MIGVEFQLCWSPEKIQGDFTSIRCDHSSAGAMPTETIHQYFQCVPIIKCHFQLLKLLLVSISL